MKFYDIYFNYTTLGLAVEKNNNDIVKLLLKDPNIDVNATYILNILF